MFNINKFPVAHQSQGNLADIIPAVMGGEQSLGALGGFGGGGGFTQGFNSAYYQGGRDSRIDLAPLISSAIGQGNFAQLNTLGGLVSPISGGLY